MVSLLELSAEEREKLNRPVDKFFACLLISLYNITIFKMNIKQFLSSKNMAILILVIGVLAVFAFVGQKKDAPLAENQQNCRPLYGTGKQTYYVQTDKPQNPQIVQVDIDPIDVKMGEFQKITVKVKDQGNDIINSKSGVSASIFTDNKTTAIASNAFKLVKAEDEKDGSKSLITIWEGYWKKEDSTCQDYVERITATNNKGEEFFTTLTFK